MGCYHPILLTIKPQLLHVGRKPVTIQPGLPSHPTVPTLSMPYTYQDVRAQLGLTLCDHMNCSLPGSSCPWDSPGKNTGMGCHFLLQGIFQTQESNPGLLHCRQMIYQLSYEGSPNLPYLNLPLEKDSMCDRKLILEANIT